MKEYHGEKAIISLTSWKARINTVGKTIYSLIKNCPGFHIVLNLTTVEFPNKEADLPQDLRIMLDNNYFEILWHKKDYKVFMKTLFTMDKYRDVPIISADDDNYPKFNYAEELYQEWLKDKTAFISYWGRPYKNTMNLGGNFTISPPFAYGEAALKYLSDKIIATREDDPYYAVLRHKLNLTNCKIISKPRNAVIEDHDCISPLRALYEKRGGSFALKIIENELKF